MDLEPTLRSMLRAGGGKTPPDWIKALSDVAARLIPHYKMTGDEFVHLCAQIAAETGGLALTPPVESYKYSAQRAAQVFSYRLKLARSRGVFPAHYSIGQIAGELAYSPRLFDVVYADRIGNGGVETQDGSKFRGRGLTQITGRSNYTAIYHEIQKQPGGKRCPDLLSNPDALCEPEWGARAAFADWHIKGMGRFVEGASDDYKRVSAMLNVGHPGKWNLVNGKKHRAHWTKYAFYAFTPEIRRAITTMDGPKQPTAPEPLDEGRVGTDVVAMQRLLVKAGYPVGEIDGEMGQLTRRALNNFQIENKLPVGPFDKKTERALIAASEEATPKMPRAKKPAKEIPDKVIVAQRKQGFWNWLLALFGVGNAGAVVADASGVPIPDAAEAMSKLRLGTEAVNFVSANKSAIAILFAGLVLVGIGRLIWLWWAAKRAAVTAYRDGALLTSSKE